MQHRPILLLVVAALTMPVAAATWSVNGAFEPDTPDDLANQRMFADPDTSIAGAKVYFNAMPSDRNGAANVNPNVGSLGMRYLPAGQMGMTAWLGVWKDCNGDGHIGQVETALLEYRSELLLDASVCPPGTVHNSGGWIVEFVALSPTTPTATQFSRVIHDEDAAVWGDFGRPERADEVHYDCAQAPFQAGTFDSTGGVLLYFDCQASYNVARTINDVAGKDVGFESEYHPEHDCDSPLNQQLDVYGRSYCNPDDPGLLESNTTAMATAWDCSGEPVADLNETGLGDNYRDAVLAVEGATGQQLLNENFLYGVIGVEVYNAAPAVGDTDASAFSAVQQASDPCAETGEDHTLNGEFLLGADFSGTNPSDGKRLADFDMGYAMPGSTGSAAVAVLPGNAGVRGPQSGAWDSGVTYLPPTYLGGTVRTQDFQPAAGIWFTFYAMVGQTTLDTLELPLETPGIYGAEACGDADEGIVGGWDCDPTHWWNPEMGGSANADGPRPGTLYFLRDTDCYDGTVVEGSGVQASLAAASTDPVCPTMFSPLG